MLTWLRCKLFLHRWERKSTEDGEVYHACHDCGTIKGGGGTSVPGSAYF
jgi:hypothetical protein